MSAQATRDAQEIQARDHALTEMIAELDLSSRAGTAIDLLVTAHRRGVAGAGTPEYEKLCMDLIPTTAVEGWEHDGDGGFRELAAVAAHGDPEHWPGLTAPAVDALGAHLQATAEAGEKRTIGMVFRASMMTDALCSHGSSLKRYERLAPVLKGLAAFVPYLPPNMYGADVALKMAELLRISPPKELSGPLQPLVQAFGQRIKKEKLSPSERRVLKRMIEDQIRNGQVAEALRPITDVL